MPISLFTPVVSWLTCPLSSMFHYPRRSLHAPHEGAWGPTNVYINFSEYMMIIFSFFFTIVIKLIFYLFFVILKRKNSMMASRHLFNYKKTLNIKNAANYNYIIEKISAIINIDKEEQFNERNDFGWNK